MITFEVQYAYYQYNSGHADNGIKINSVSFDTLESAKNLKRKIEKGIKLHLKDSSTIQPIKSSELKFLEEMQLRYMNYSGYFKWVKIWEVQRKQIN